MAPHEKVLPINPAENFGIVRIGVAEGDPVGPVLCETVFLCHGFESGRADCHLHQDVGLLCARVVLPQRCQRFVSTTVT
jgi:hypothetical protein